MCRYIIAMSGSLGTYAMGHSLVWQMMDKYLSNTLPETKT